MLYRLRAIAHTSRITPTNPGMCKDAKHAPNGLNYTLGDAEPEEGPAPALNQAFVEQA